MGQKNTYACPACGFSALISGGRDAGMDCTTITIECLTCQILVDAVDSYWNGEDGLETQSVECPVHPEHRWREWTYPGACPKCGAAMELTDGYGLLWD